MPQKLKHRTFEDASVQSNFREAFRGFSDGEIIVFRSDDEDHRDLARDLFSEVFKTMGFGGGMDWGQIEEAAERAIEVGDADALVFRAIHPAQQTIRHAKEICLGLCPALVLADRDFPVPMHDLRVTVLTDQQSGISDPPHKGFGNV